MTQERRRWPRIELFVDARVTLHGAAWTGAALNMSVGGVYLVFGGSLPVSENQVVQLGLETEAGILEIRGRVRRQQADSGPGAVPTFPHGLAVEFEALDTIRERILSSLLEGLRHQEVSVKISGLLIPQETGELLLEVSASGAAGEPSLLEAGAPMDQERRLVPRLELEIPVHLEPYDKTLAILDPETLTIDLSATGARLLFLGERIQAGDRLMLRLSLSHDSLSRPRRGRAAAPDCSTVVAKIVWVNRATPPCAASPCCIGVQFLHHSYDGQRRLAQLLTRAVSERDWSEAHSDAPTVASTAVEFQNSTGQRVLAYLDRPDEPLPDAPLTIIAPGYGETKRDYIALGYYLASNGFQVLRYDHTNHIGESDGEMAHTTLTGMGGDLSAAVAFARTIAPSGRVAIVAANLAGRGALKLAAQDLAVDILVLVNPIVNLQSTLTAVHQEDLIVTFLRGVRRGVTNMLGFNINVDRFLEDAIREGYADLRSTVRDAKMLPMPVIVLAAASDPWVQLESVKEVHAALPAGSGQLGLLPDVFQRLQENTRQAPAVFRQVVASCRGGLGLAASRDEVLEPCPADIARQRRYEDERARMDWNAKVEGREFWQEYLEHSPSLLQVSEYWQLLDHIARLLEEPHSRTGILDAGCGSGNLGAFLLVKHAQEPSGIASGNKPVRYVGVDFVQPALARARAKFVELAAETGAGYLFEQDLPPLLKGSLLCADLNRPLPFRDSQFDSVVCNLVLNYLADPVFTLGELLRVLSLKGRLVITTLKSRADLSGLSVSTGEQHENSKAKARDEMRWLAETSGRLREAQGLGACSFDRQEMAMLLLLAGAVQPRVYTAFGNQAYLAVAEKPAITRQPSPSRARMGALATKEISLASS